MELLSSLGLLSFHKGWSFTFTNSLLIVYRQILLIEAKNEVLPKSMAF